MTDSLPEGLDGYEAGQYGLTRALGTGWELCAMHDPSGRRGVWCRRFSGGIEICGGREGDDFYHRIMLNDPAYAAVVDICDWLRAGAEDQANDPATGQEGDRLRGWFNAEKTGSSEARIAHTLHHADELRGELTEEDMATLEAARLNSLR